MAMVPASKPRMSLAEVLALVTPLGLNPATDKLFVVGVRGYYRDTMGQAGKNDRRMYDDAIFLVSDSAFASFNANVDPSGVRLGRGDGAAKGMASLKSPQLCRVHRFDLHKGKYLALCQRAGPVTVIRDGTPPEEHRGMYGINIHKGGFNTTSSAGCQTLYPAQWDAFITLAQTEAKRLAGAGWRQLVVPYALVDNPQT